VDGVLSTLVLVLVLGRGTVTAARLLVRYILRGMVRGTMPFFATCWHFRFCRTCIVPLPLPGSTYAESALATWWFALPRAFPFWCCFLHPTANVVGTVSVGRLVWMTDNVRSLSFFFVRWFGWFFGFLLFGCPAGPAALRLG